MTSEGLWSSETRRRCGVARTRKKVVGYSEKRGGVGSVRSSPHARVDHLHTALEPIIKVSLASATGQNLRLDHQLGLGCGATWRISAIPVPVSGASAASCSPKLLATSSASEAENAGTALGVGMPYCAGSQSGRTTRSKSRRTDGHSIGSSDTTGERASSVCTYRVEQLDRLILVNREVSALLPLGVVERLLRRHISFSSRGDFRRLAVTCAEPRRAQLASQRSVREGRKCRSETTMGGGGPRRRSSLSLVVHWRHVSCSDSPSQRSGRHGDP
jgi:hypothetical protein